MIDYDKEGQKTGLARTYGESGALKDLLNKIGDPSMKNLEDIYELRERYEPIRRKLVDDSISQIGLRLLEMKIESDRMVFEREELLKNKSENLNQTIIRLDRELAQPYQPGNLFFNLYHKLKRWAQDKKVKSIKNNFEAILRGTTKKYDKRIAHLGVETEYISNNIQKVAEDNISDELRRITRVRNKIEDEKYLLYGALGERDVINKLRELPEGYHVINDLKSRFNPPIYNRAEKDRIRSIQVDHIVVGPGGIFIVETKNWSSESISNDMFFLPVKQVQRTGFALFVLLNRAVKSGIIRMTGGRKISPKQILVFRNNISEVQVQFVKVLGIERLNPHILRRKKEFSPGEIQSIVNYLLHIG